MRKKRKKIRFTSIINKITHDPPPFSYYYPAMRRDAQRTLVEYSRERSSGAFQWQVQPFHLVAVLTDWVPMDSVNNNKKVDHIT